MTQDEIINLARKAGFAAVLAEHASEYGNGTLENTPYPQLEAFADLVAAAEREACAKVCLSEWSTHGQMEAGGVFAAAIRARGQA